MSDWPDRVHSWTIWVVGGTVINAVILWGSAWSAGVEPAFQPAFVGLLLTATLILQAVAWVVIQGGTYLYRGWVMLRQRRRARQTDRILDLAADGRFELISFWWGSGFYNFRAELKPDVGDWLRSNKIRVYAFRSRYGDVSCPKFWFRRPADAVAFKLRWY